MTRVLSALVLLPILLGVVLLLPAWGTIALGLLVVGIAAVEFCALADAGGTSVSRVLVVVATAAACASVAGGIPVEVPLLVAVVAIGAAAVGRGRPGDDTLRSVSCSLMAPVYLGLPVGALVAVRVDRGPEVLLLGLFTIMSSDVAQYYGGRAFGRRPLAPVVSPKKTVEGAGCGIVAAAVVLPALGTLWLSQVPAALLAGLGVTLALLGIAGDLFESLLKRSAGVKDTSALIPGHGGVLDRIDSLLFAGPVYYLVLRYL